MTNDEANKQLDDAMTEADKAYWKEAEKRETEG